MTVKELAIRVDALEAENTQLKEQLLALKKGDSVARNITAEPRPKTPTETFKVGDAEYQFTYARYINSDGNLVLAKNQIDNPKELERLVAIKSGIIKAVG